ncbi:GNAT family N-acetyltransferase [Dictyobacter arantiisoli]|uniref:N-acetyltransferase n=1 Tax=Dictyobacter arantiisoli TaxID=2014874 RepID=A0A5A5T8G6_9CHLR|nr:GNAT family N-acetyltransferase [Dictyobacter arantiisoli]GCF07702.1 N-acetyltransferase [Dictyobacter arantiisoli]
MSRGYIANNRKDVRLLSSEDIPAIERLLRTSEYIYQRFTLSELPLLIKHYPAVGLWNGSTLHGFLLSQIIKTPFAWFSGFGVSWSNSKEYVSILAALLDELYGHLLARGVQYFNYSGNDSSSDWLRTLLLARSFIPYQTLYSYDKFDYKSPSQGNQNVILRPVDLTRDLPALLDIEMACFEEIWRYDAISFHDIEATHPYFKVVELNGQVVGYQFNALDDEYGYLVRIAVHPSATHKGIGVRLMAEAVRFFEQARVSRIMLNTQEDNYHAHQLYEWFGFIRLQQKGFVLRKTL